MLFNNRGWYSADQLTVVTFTANEYNSSYTAYSEPIKLRASGVTYFNGGNVGIGTTSPGVRFEVVDTTANWTGSFKNYTANAYGLRIDLSGSSGVQAALQVYTATGSGMIVTNDGKVGIGTTSPVNKLHVAGAGNAAGGNIHMGDNADASNTWSYLTGAHYNGATHTTGFSLIGGYSSSAANIVVIGGSIYEAHPSTQIQFWTHTATTHATGGSERMRIDTNGNLLIGTTSADPTTTGSSGRVVIQTANGGQAALTAFNPGTGATNIISLENGNGQVGRIQVNGSATSYLTSSDSRLKENVKPITDSSDIIDRLAPKKFDWKTGGKNAYGFIAQEAIEVFPEAVSAGDSEDEIKSPWAMDYSKLVPVLVAELQSLRARLAALEAK